MGIYVEGDFTRVTCHRCGIDFKISSTTYAANKARNSKATDLCRDCRAVTREGKK